MVFEEFCGSPLLWEDTNISVQEHGDNSSSWKAPDFTPCFQSTILVWIPCGYIFFITPFYFYHLVAKMSNIIPHTPLNITKTVAGVVLLVLCFVNLFRYVYTHSQGQPLFPAFIWSPAINLLSVEPVYPVYLIQIRVLAVILMQFGRQKGIRCTGVLFVFWLLQLIVSIIWIRSHSLRFRAQNSVEEYAENADMFGLVWSCLFGALVLIEWVLSNMVDKPPSKANMELSEMSPESSATFLSILSFWWFTSLIVKGYKRALERSDLFPLNPHDKSNSIVPAFESNWNFEVAKSNRSSDQITAHCKTSIQENAGTDGDVQFHLLNGDPDRNVTIKQPHRSKGSKSAGNAVQPRLWVALMRTYGKMFLFAASLKLVHDILLFVSPVLLKLVIGFTQNKSESSWHGYMYVVLLFIVAFVQSLLLHQYFHKCMVTGLRVRTAIIAAVYKKSLVLSSKSRQISTVGEIVNLMSVDAQRFMELTTYLNMLWSAPFQMCVCLYFLWMTLGPSILAGVAVMVLLIPINAYIAKKNRALQVQQMVYKDERIKLMNEILNGIKVLKLYAWELSFQQKVLDIREKELNVLKRSAFLHAATSFTWTCAPFLVSLTTFAVYVLSSPENVLDAEKAFVSLALFNILRFPLSMLPMLIANMVQVSVSLKRVLRFLVLEELNPDNVEFTKEMDSSINIKDGTFTWETGAEDRVTLKDINIDVAPGSLVAVVGVVGCGKSSLLSAILGEMEKLGGQVKIKGSMAYVAQQAWIQNDILRENILFGQSVCEPGYTQLLEACALQPDLEILPNSDLTEIGEKGINLSGGQKQRVSLARAVYSDADVYLLDDPLSAVDSHVGRHIFDKVIGPTGLLAGKTRVLVTHGISYLPQMDQVIVLVDGEVSEVGTYQQLLDRRGAFADFLRIYIAEKLEVEDEVELTEDLKIEEILSQIGGIGSIDVSQSSEKVARIRRDTVQSHTSVDSSTNPHSPDIPSQVFKRSVSHSNNESGSKTNLSKTSSHNSKCKPSENLLKNAKETDKMIKDEVMETGSVKLSVFHAYMKSIGLWLSAVIIIMYTLNNIASVGANFWLSDWSNDAVNGTVDTDQRDLRLGVYGALGFAQAILDMASAIVMALCGVSASRHLHFQLVSGLLRSKLDLYFTTSHGRFLNRFVDDIDEIDNVMPFTVRSMINAILQLISTVIVIMSTTAWFLLILPFATALFLPLQRFYVATSRQLKRLESVSRSPIYSHFGETVQGAVTIRAYQQQHRFIRESDARVDENQICYYPSVIANRWLAVRLEIVGNCIVFFSALFAVIGRDHLSAGVVGLSITYALNITQTLNWMVRMTSELETNIVAVERVKEYSETPTEADWVVEVSRPPPEWPEKGEIQLANYSTRYRQGLDLVLHDINCHIKSGEKVGLVGRTGAGKSSLTLSLFRIIEAAAGSISVDGINIADIGLHDLRSRLTIIPQDPVLFSGSLRMNLDPFEENSDADLYTALEHAHLKAYVTGLSEGLQHMCTEGGENLSVGQRQLICLARALLRKTQILILDEATAAVDLETDDLIQSTIRTEFKKCTVLTIAHRLNTIMDNSRIMVFEQGELVEFDEPQTLLQKKTSIFYRMAQDAGLVG